MIMREKWLYEIWITHYSNSSYEHFSGDGGGHSLTGNFANILLYSS